MTSPNTCPICKVAVDLCVCEVGDDAAKKLLVEAESLLKTAWAAMMKMGLRDRGSDIGLPHEVRMFAAHFSDEGRDGPGALQIRGTGRFRSWLMAVREHNKRSPTYPEGMQEHP